ncbi:MAG: hypothetical protein ACPG5P_07595 [Saprospiraceae bacterium]
MKKSNKILLGILTFSPFIGLGLYMLFFFGMFFSIATIDPSSTEPPLLFMGGFGILFIILGLTILISLVLTIYYLVHAVNNKHLKSENNEQIIWILILLLAGNLGQIVYWYMKIWQDPELEISHEILDDVV